MFCPKCGQEQTVKGQRFCSGCGISLEVFESLMVWGEAMSREGGTVSKGLQTRKDGIKWSILIFIVGVFALTPLAVVLEADTFVPLFAVLGFGAAAILMAYSLMFLPKEVKGLDGSAKFYKPVSGGMKGVVGNIRASMKEKIGGSIHDTADQNETRPMSYVPPAGDWRDIQYPQPRSVTDSTTKLLVEEEEKKKQSDQ